MIEFRVSEITLDDSLVKQLTDKVIFSGLSRFGYRVRAAAKKSIVKRKKTSQPGKPPSSRTGALKNFILYSVEKPEKSVVIGPSYLQRKSKYAVQSLENGGISISPKGQRLNISARPFMVPAFDKTILNSVPGVFQNAVK
jgi:hypothetical protein